MVVLQLLSTGLVCAIGILFIIAVHICILRRSARENPSRNDDQTENSMVALRVQSEESTECPSLSSFDFENLPCFSYDAEDDQKGSNTISTECAVCLESFKIGEKCRLLPICGHSFHVSCIDSWLLKTPTCPVCRKCHVPV